MNEQFNFQIISIDITERCDMNCKHCRTTKDGFQFPLSKIKLIIDKISILNPKIIVISGGEPFLRDDIFDIIKYIKLKDIAIQINSNGKLIDKLVLEKLKKLEVDYLQLSLDGVKEKHNYIREEGNYEKIVSLSKIVSNYTKLILNTTVSKYNLDCLTDLAEELFCKQSILPHIWGLKRFVPYNKFADKQQLNKEGLLLLVNKWQELNKIYKHITIKTDIPQTNLINIENTKRIAKKHNLNICGCSAGHTVLTIRANGDVSPCPTINMCIGNIITDSLDVILRNSILKELASRENLTGKCGTCKNKMYCGGCRAIAYISSNNILGEDTECYIN
jgi:radical SAM protein with 4Fe4S-binding SPASM domain